MADVETLFNVLDDGTGAGTSISKVEENDAAASKRAVPALIGKDGSGQLRYIKVNADGEPVISLEAGDIACLSDSGTHAGSASFQDLATITAQLNKVYRNFQAIASSFRDTVFQLVHIDDVGGTPTETILIDGFRVGSGDYNAPVDLKCLTYDTTGGTGVQNFVLRGKNLNVTSTMDAALSVEEVQ